jgi:hypothetical protein
MKQTECVKPKKQQKTSNEIITKNVYTFILSLAERSWRVPNKLIDCQNWMF